MAYTYNFVDNFEYGNDELNSIRSDFSTKGIFKATDTSCKVINSLTTPGKLLIMGGSAIFSNGGKITIDTEGAELAPIAGSKNYIWLKWDDTLNNASPQITTTPPTGKYVNLAERAVDGDIIDKREYAKSNVLGYDSNISSSVFKSASGHYVLSGVMSWVLVNTVDMLIDFRRAVMSIGGSSLGVYDFSGDPNSQGMHATIHIIPAVLTMAYDVGFKKVNTNLEIYIKPGATPSYSYTAGAYGIFFV